MKPIMVNAGGAGLIFRLDSDTYTDTVVDPADAVGSWAILSNRSVAASGPVGYDWVNAGATVAQYQVVITLVSGTFTTGAAGTYGLNAGVTLTKGRTSPGAASVTFSARIQRITDLVWMTSLATITLTANVDV